MELLRTYQCHKPQTNVLPCHTDLTCKNTVSLLQKQSSPNGNSTWADRDIEFDGHYDPLRYSGLDETSKAETAGTKRQCTLPPVNTSEVCHFFRKMIVELRSN